MTLSSCSPAAAAGVSSGMNSGRSFFSSSQSTSSTSCSLSSSWSPVEGHSAHQRRANTKGASLHGEEECNHGEEIVMTMPWGEVHRFHRLFLQLLTFYLRSVITSHILHRLTMVKRLERAKHIGSTLSVICELRELAVSWKLEARSSSSTLKFAADTDKSIGRAVSARVSDKQFVHRA
jgi:hypothetical protein